MRLPPTFPEMPRPIFTVEETYPEHYSNASPHVRMLQIVHGVPPSVHPGHSVDTSGGPFYVGRQNWVEKAPRWIFEWGTDLLAAFFVVSAAVLCVALLTGLGFDLIRVAYREPPIFMKPEIGVVGWLITLAVIILTLPLFIILFIAQRDKIADFARRAYLPMIIGPFQTWTECKYFSNRSLLRIHRALEISAGSIFVLSTLVGLWRWYSLVSKISLGSFPGTVTIEVALIGLAAGLAAMAKSWFHIEHRLSKSADTIAPGFPGVSRIRSVPEKCCSISSYRIVHLSDLHLTDCSKAKTLEQKPSPNRMARLIFHRISKLEELDLVVITGDVTDSGTRMQWMRFFEITTQDSNPSMLEKTIIVPGNHDINVLSSVGNVQGPDFMLRKERLIRFLAAMDHVQGSRALVWPEREKEPLLLRDYLEPFWPALEKFASDPPRRVERRIRVLKHYKYVDITDDFERSWFDLPDFLWDSVFPMAVPVASGKGVVVILDSCQHSPRSIVENAYGYMTKSSLERIGRIRESFTSRAQSPWFVFAMHHHVTLPNEGSSALERLQNRFLTLLNASELFEKIQDGTILLHGHRHLDYFGVASRVELVSSPSSTFGSKRPFDGGRGAGFWILGLDESPGLGVLVSSRSWEEIE